MQKSTILFLGTCVSTFLAGSAMAAPYGMAGCGLGSVFIKEKGIIQIFAATTNGTSGNQTSGITSGTSNCVSGERAAQLQQQENFFVNNMSNLSKEIARGDGESVRALSEQFGCPVSTYDEVRITLQGQHAYIFAAPGAVASLERSKKILRDNSQLQTACHDLT